MTSSSQAGQDLFVWVMTQHKNDGFFLDIGCNDPMVHSNSYGLEQSGWSGLLVDVVGGCETRRSPFIKCDAAHPNERLLFHYSQMPDVVDFISVDVDENLPPVLQAVPFSKHVFRVVVVETDYYLRGEHPRWASRALLSALGYTLVCGDVKIVPPGMDSPQPFEDWWIWPELINPALVKKYKCEGQLWSDILKR